MKSNNGRLQDEVSAKSRQIDELLNPGIIQSNDIRRTLTSKKPDTSEVVMSLRRKVYKAEENVRDKENVIRYVCASENNHVKKRVKATKISADQIFQILWFLFRLLAHN